MLGCLLAVQADYELKRVGLASRAMLLTATYHQLLHLPPAARREGEAAGSAGRGRLISLLTQVCSAGLPQRWGASSSLLPPDEGGASLSVSLSVCLYLCV